MTMVTLEIERARRARVWLGSLAFASTAIVAGGCGAQSSAVSPSYGGSGPPPAMTAMSEPAPERPGLGTTFGEVRDSPVRHVSFTRAGDTPLAEARLFY